ncbi:MAG TPA: endonuclease MutS2 [Gemmatimonadaceae bacterium]|nr:endonuclease MutS2 [Gemmatimonadaceae bacterium]
MNRHALAVLEYSRTLALVAGRCASTQGAQRIQASEPTSDRVELERIHSRVAAARALAEGDLGCPSEAIPEVNEALERLRVAGSVLSGEALMGLATLLRSSRLTNAALGDDRQPPLAIAVLRDLRERLFAAPKPEERLAKAFEPDGALRDDASPALRNLRRELRAGESELLGLLERAMQKLEPHQRVADMSVTMRNGRWVIPIRREARVAVGGLVHDASGSGNTLFVEPPAAIEACNRLRELEAEEAAEVERILAELTDAVRPLHEDLVRALEALVELDTLRARARFASEYRCGNVVLGEPADGFAIRDGRHPLLLAQGIAVVPFDLTMAPNERTLLVSGPNTGGKTVLLKCLGLFATLAQSGIPVPVAPGSRLAVLDDVFADIGDEQSIEASLSTFSAHVKNLAEILARATPRSLVLIDELGSGTDPVEGAALGGAILEALTTRGVLTVATTHLGALKELAADTPGVVNASLQFDEEALAPTYQLIKGLPGRSYGLRIAHRLRLPDDVLRRAEERVPKSERDVNALLATLEERERALSERERDVASSQESASARAKRLAERERNVRERERRVERESRQEARRFLLDARSDVERTIRSLKQSESDQLEAAAKEARRRIEELAEVHSKGLDALDAAEAATPNEEGRDVGAISAGDTVDVLSLGGRPARVVEVRGDAALVAFDAVKLTVALTDVRRSAAGASPAVRVPLLGDVPEVQARNEIDVRGMRVDEIDDVVMQALDAAIRADLKSLRIIHGKGTGALRARVAEMLQKDTRVAAFRLGAWNEGGAGVTVAEL